MIRVQCSNPECNKAYSVDESRLGDTAVCRHCGRKFVVSESVVDTARSQATPAASAAGPRVSCGGDPAQIGRFEIRCRLGLGGFGAVYQAYDPVLAREVALKVPHPGRFENDEDKARVLREAKASARLHHPHIVPVYDAGGDGQSFYIASAFVEGETLEHKATQQPLPYRDIARIVMKLADALEHAHSLGIVHRDVKPSNIMLDQRGEPMLMDFGTARMAESDSMLTHDGTVLGTPAYMAPEQAKGRQDHVGPASDQYSLGVVLYRLLCGRVPFAGGTHAVMYHVLHRDPEPPRTVNPQVPVDLEVMCLKAMAKEPERRYAGCRELAEDLGRYLRGEPVAARPISRLERIWRWCRRNPLIASGLAVIAVSLVALAVVSTLFAVYQTKSARALSTALDESEQHLRQSQHRLAENELDQGIRLCQQGEIGLGMLWLAQSLKTMPDGDDDLQRPARANLAAWADELCPLVQVIPLERAGNNDHDLVLRSFSPDGRFLLVLDKCAELRVYDVATGRQMGETIHSEAEVHEAISSAVFSADSKMLAVEVRNWGEGAGKIQSTICVWATDDIRNNAPRIRYQGTSVVDWRLLPDDSLLVAQVEQQQEQNVVQVWDGSRGVRIGVKLPGVEPVAISPDGTRLAAAIPPVQVAVPKEAAPRPEKEGRGTDNHLTDKQETATGGDTEPPFIQVWEVTTGRSIGPPVQFDVSNRLTRWIFSPDSRRLLITWIGEDEEGGLLWDIDGGQRIGRPLAFPAFECSKPFGGFSNDGQIAVLFDGRIAAAYDAATGSRRWPATPFSTISPLSFGLEIGSDARTAAGMVAFSKAQLRDIATGRAIGQPLKCSHNRFAISESVQSIATLSDDTFDVRIWGRPHGARHLSVPSMRDIREYHQVGFSPDGEKLFVLPALSNTVYLWNAGTGEPLGTLVHPCSLSACQFSPDSRILWTTTFEGLEGRLLWDTTTCRLLESQPFRDMRQRPCELEFSPDGKFVIAAGENGYDYDDESARVREVATGRPVAELQGHEGRLICVQFAPSGETAIVTYKQGTRMCHGVWDVRNRTVVPTKGDAVSSVAKPLRWGPSLVVAPERRPFDLDPLDQECAVGDGETALVASTDALRLLHARTGKQVGPLLPRSPSNIIGKSHDDFDVSPDGWKVALVTADAVELRMVPGVMQGDSERIRLWVEVQTGMELAEDNEVRVLDRQVWLERRKRLESLGGPPPVKR